MESTSNRMSRLGKSLITDTELLSLDRLIAEIDAVDQDAVTELAAMLLEPERLSASGIGPDEDVFAVRGRERQPGARPPRRCVKVCLYGRGGKVGRVLAPALEAAGHELVDLTPRRPRSTSPRRTPSCRTCSRALDAGVPCVIGTSGADLAPVDERARERGLPAFYAPNFAIGAVLMMRLAAEAAKFLPRAEIVELHNEAKKDAPSGTARATAELLRRRRRSTRCVCPGWSRTRRCCSAARGSC